MTEPIVIAGMHRSGTSLVTRTLQSAGLFIGRSLESNQESLFFQRLNDELLRGAGSRWDHPGGFLRLREELDPAGHAAIEAYLRRRLASLQRSSFSWRSIGAWASGGAAWGWKDPRSSLTWWMWRRIFPGARYIVLDRHGVDVAISLFDRVTRRKRVGVELPGNRLRYYLMPRRGDLTPQAGVYDLSSALELWGEYMQELAHLEAELPGQVLRVRYEELLSNPEETLSRILGWCGLKTAKGQIEALCAGVDASRAEAWRTDPRGGSLARDGASTLARWGYA